MPPSTEERLARIEEMLLDVLRRLEELESWLGKDENLAVAGELLGAFNLPVYRALEASRIIVRLARYVGRMDDITRAIIEALAVEGPLTIRGLEREVRRIRGSASRRIIVSRIRELERMGVVEVERKPGRSLVRLRSVGEEGSDS